MAKDEISLPNLTPEIIRVVKELGKTIEEAKAGYALLKEAGIASRELEDAIAYIERVGGAFKKHIK